MVQDLPRPSPVKGEGKSISIFRDPGRDCKLKNVMRIIYSLSIFLFYISGLNFNLLFAMEPKNQDKIPEEINLWINKIFSSKDMQNLSLQKGHPKNLGWDIYPEEDIDSGFVLREGDRDILYFFPAKGSYYLQYLPESEHLLEDYKNQKKLKDRINLKKELEKNNFPSPKHRYGIEAELNWLENQIKDKRIYAKFLAVKGDLLIFYLPGSNYDSRITNFLSNTPLDENVLEIPHLYYAFKRDYPEDMFNQYPKVKTIIMRSIDEHSLGPSGIQIENRME